MSSSTSISGAGASGAFQGGLGFALLARGTIYMRFLAVFLSVEEKTSVFHGLIYCCLDHEHQYFHFGFSKTFYFRVSTSSLHDVLG